MNPPYIRAVQRDLKQYISARGGRTIPVGYSAAQIQNILVDTDNYIQCAIDGDSSDMSRADFFGLNDYQWCGDNTFTGSGYSDLVDWFSNTTIPVFFSEYGCNKVLPRTFQEVTTIYSQQMSVLSGGLVYQWTQDTNNYGLIKTNDDGSAKILADYNTLKAQYAKLDTNFLQTQNSTATSLKPAKCDADLISSPGFNSSFVLPAQPSGAADLIKNGIPNAPSGKIVSVTQTAVQAAVTGTDGSTMSGLKITPVSGANTPGSASTSGKKNAGAAVGVGEIGWGLSAVVAVLGLVGLY